jgi:hypothetical protein
VLNDSGYILGSGEDTRITLGALLEFLLMIGNVGTAVAPMAAGSGFATE